MGNWKNILNNDYLSLLIRIAVGAIFIYASIDKITHPAQFARIVYNYHLVPSDFINIFALFLPWVELAAGICIIMGIWKEGGVLLANLLVLSFIIALSINLARGVNLECGCFTVSSKAKSNIISLLARDFGLLTLTVYLFINSRTKFCLIRTH